MTDAAVLFVKPKAISTRDKKALQGAGIIVVEVDDPQAVKLVRAHAELSGGDLLACAADVIANKSFDSVRAAFGRAVCEAFLHAHRFEPAPAKPGAQV